MDHYVFSDQAEDRERERLQLVEAAFDPRSRALLEAVGLSDGHRCLEVAAGAGSIARWLRDRVGPTGRLTAVDVNTRYLNDLAESPGVVVKGDAATVDLGSDYDIAHCRYMLIHHPDPDSVIANIHRALRTGGFIVCEEPDFQGARSVGLGGGDDPVSTAIGTWFQQRGLDPGFGAHLPARLAACGFRLVDVEGDCHLCAGGSPVAKVMRASIEALREKYVETGRATDDDIDAYVREAGDPDTWRIYYTTVRVTAQKL